MRTLAPHLWILHCPAGGGHRAAALALAEHASDHGATTTVVDALSFTPRWFAKGYVETHLKSTSFAPWAYGFGYHQLDRPHPALDRVRRHVDGVLGRRLLAAVQRAEPDVVVCTHFFPLSVLARARRRGQLTAPVVGVVTDFAAHAFWAEPGVDAFCVTDGGPALDLARHGAPPAAIHQTGVPVRRAFANLPAAPSAGTPLHVLATSGGFGIGPLEAALRSFRGVANVRLTVVCGADESKRERVARLVVQAGLDARVLGFERDMAARMAEAHVVLGKPGGSTVSEALAAGRPMALMGTCPGQEAHNEEWLTLNGAAVSVHPSRAGSELAALAAHGALEPMARAARRLGRPHAASAVLNVALGLRRALAA